MGSWGTGGRATALALAATMLTPLVTMPGSALASDELTTATVADEDVSTQRMHDQPTSDSSDLLEGASKAAPADRPEHRQEIAGSGEPLPTEGPPRTGDATQSAVAQPDATGEIMSLAAGTAGAEVATSDASNGYGPGDPVGVDDFYAVFN